MSNSPPRDRSSVPASTGGAAIARVERWNRIKECFHAVLAQPPENRLQAASDICGDDEELRGEVLSLIRAGDDAGSFLEVPAIGGLLGNGTGPDVGGQLGAYRILREIGAGGMGRVYLATRADDEYRKHVAIKVMAGAMFGDFMLGRFRNERQILASLDHPNIARLYDGGTSAEGTPYIVMEFVEGEPIDEYCAAHQLSIRERIALFMQVCLAVQNAHAHLVIHRDLKPANILINHAGEPKLLDFGIAKLLETEDSLEMPTATGLRLMTPSYASPEQMRGIAISTVSDVYSLGVILYELLAGHRPHVISGTVTPEAIRVVCEVEPLRPSAVLRRTSSNERQAREVHGDLDRIVLKALAKDPDHRYSSAEQLAHDLERYLHGQPVHARDATLGYRVRKFVRRNRTYVASAAVVVLSLVSSTIYSIHAASVAEAQRIRAEQHAAVAKARFDDVRGLANSLLFEVHNALQPLPGSLEVRQMVTGHALKYLDRLATQTGDDAELLSELAVAYNRLGTITYGVEATLRIQQRAVAINEKLVSAHPASLQYQHGLAVSLLSLANVLKLNGDHKGELATYQRALRIADRLRLAEPASLQHLELLKEVYDAIGGTQAALQQRSESIASHRHGLALARKLTSLREDSQEYRRQAAVSLNLLSMSLVASGRFDEARVNYREALDTIEDLVASDPENNIYRRDLWYLHRGLGTVLSLQGQHHEALTHLATSLALKERLVAADPSDGGHRRGLAVTHMFYGDALARGGNRAAARSRYLRAVELEEALLLDDPGNQETYDDLNDEYSRMRQALEDPAERQMFVHREKRLYERILSHDRGNAKAARALELASRSGRT